LKKSRFDEVPIDPFGSNDTPLDEGNHLILKEKNEVWKLLYVWSSERHETGSGSGLGLGASPLKPDSKRPILNAKRLTFCPMSCPVKPSYGKDRRADTGPARFLS
jgi:hypothetical protein